MYLQQVNPDIDLNVHKIFPFSYIIFISFKQYNFSNKAIITLYENMLK